MRNKAFLSLMELICMAGVFALAAAICIRGFLLANSISSERRMLDNAVNSAQNAAELLKSHQGDVIAAAAILYGSVDEDSLVVFYNTDWQPVADEEDAEYILRTGSIHTDTEIPTLAQSEIRVSRGEECLFSLTVGWQEAEQ